MGAGRRRSDPNGGVAATTNNANVTNEGRPETVDAPGGRVGAGECLTQRHEGTEGGAAEGTGGDSRIDRRGGEGNGHHRETQRGGGGEREKPRKIRNTRKGRGWLPVSRSRRGACRILGGDGDRGFVGGERGPCRGDGGGIPRR